MSTPNRREFLALGAATTGALFERVSTLRQDAPPARPNLLIVCSDQQHYQALGFVVI